MRTWIVFAILAAALTGLAVSPAEARSGGSGVATGHFARATPGHSFFVPRQHFAGRVVVFNSNSGRFFAVNRLVSIASDSIASDSIGLERSNSRRSAFSMDLVVLTALVTLAPSVLEALPW
jgi:hypothetical protein